MEDGVNVTRLAGQTPTISCSGTAATVEFAPQTASMTCNLNGFEITHPTGVGAGIFLDGTSQSVTTTISNCNIHDIFDGVGIRLDGTVSCTIQDNTIYDCAEAGIGSSGTLSSGSSVTIEGNTIGALSPNHNQEAGIFIMGSGSVTVVIGSTGASNFIHFNGESGIRLDTITDLTIDNNTIRNNTKAGILLIDVGTSGVGNEAIVKNSTIQSNSKAGINIGGESYLIVGTNNIIFNNSTGGIAFNMGDVVLDPGAPSSGPVTVTGNDHINGNTFGGIGVIDAISTTNTVRITENTIYSNFRGGIGIQNDCKLEITKNTIRNNVRGGIKTGDDSIDPGGFSGTPGSANLTIKQNKVYGNGASGIGGGIDVRHAGGSIYNNLVYENHRGGIRFGDWIDEIVNNTVADNGNDNGTPADTDDNVGGGIIYDDISAGDPVNAQPAGNPPAPIPIRNNICTHNYRAGIRACFTNTEGSEERDYNLVYSNNATGATDCGWPDSLVMSCVNQNLGGCGGIWDLPDPPKVLMDGPNNKAADPLFENRTADDYRIQSDSPAVDAGDIAYGTDVSIPPGVGAPTIDMGAFGGPDGIDW
jgi:parallel beta-helix repeat protein